MASKVLLRGETAIGKVNHCKLYDIRDTPEHERPLVQGMVFAATEAEWKAYEQLSCKAILGMPFSPLFLTP